MNAYLIEARAIGGVSGSLVFVWSSGIGGLSGTFSLLGLIHGHWGIAPEDRNSYSMRPANGGKVINMGIATVVPAKKILEVFAHPELIQMRRAAEQREAAKR